MAGNPLQEAMQAVRNHPRDAAAWTRLGELLRDSGEADKAAECFARAHRLIGGAPAQQAAASVSPPPPAPTVPPPSTPALEAAPINVSIVADSAQLGTGPQDDTRPPADETGVQPRKTRSWVTPVGIGLVIVIVLSLLGVLAGPRLLGKGRGSSAPTPASTTVALANQEPGTPLRTETKGVPPTPSPSAAPSPSRSPSPSLSPTPSLLPTPMAIPAWQPAVQATVRPTVDHTPGPNGFVPGDPTATPLGEDITDANFVAGREAYWVTKDYPQVIVLMNEVLATDPDLAPAYWYRGMGYFYMGDYPSTVADMNKALALDPDYAVAYADRGTSNAALGRIAQAWDDWYRALEIDPSLAKVHHNMAIAYYQQGDIERSLEEYDATVAIDFHRASAWAQRSENLWFLGGYEECVASAEQAIELDTDQTIAYFYRGTCNSALGNNAAAIADLQLYDERDPTCPNGPYNLGIAYENLGQLDLALASYNQSLAISPRKVDALINRGGVYRKLGQYDAALDDYNAALAQGEIPAAYSGRGDIYFALADFDQAEQDYRRAIALMPVFDRPYCGLAQVLLVGQEYPAAVDAANRGIGLATDIGTWGCSLQTRGRIYYAQGDYEQAIADFDELIANHPDVISYYYRGIAYHDSGQKEKAIEDLGLFLSQAGPDTSPTAIADAERRLGELKQ
jgi:tetratricopeptide (TPR) repeat protein